MNLNIHFWCKNRPHEKTTMPLDCILYFLQNIKNTPKNNKCYIILNMTWYGRGGWDTNF